MTHRDIEKKAEELITPIVEEFSFELVDVEYVKEAGEMYLRAYIEKPGGITINDCEAVSRKFSDRLDEEDFIDDAYIMEVSSPGLGRALKKDRDFERSIGQKVEIKLYAPQEIEGAGKASKEFEGELSGYDKDTVTVTDDNGNELVFQRSAIALIRLAVEF